MLALLPSSFIASVTSGAASSGQCPGPCSSAGLVMATSGLGYGPVETCSAVLAGLCSQDAPFEHHMPMQSRLPRAAAAAGGAVRAAHAAGLACWEPGLACCGPAGKPPVQRSMPCRRWHHLGIEQARAELVLAQVLAQQASQGLEVAGLHQGLLPGCCRGCPAGLHSAHQPQHALRKAGRETSEVLSPHARDLLLGCTTVAGGCGKGRPAGLHSGCCMSLGKGGNGRAYARLRAGRSGWAAAVKDGQQPSPGQEGLPPQRLPCWGAALHGCASDGTWHGCGPAG